MPATQANKITTAAWLKAVHPGEEQKAVAAYTRLLKNPTVRRDLEALCFDDAPTFDPASDRQSAFNEGLRFALLHMRAVADFDLNQLEEDHARTDPAR